MLSLESLTTAVVYDYELHVHLVKLFLAFSRHLFRLMIYVLPVDRFNSFIAL